MGQVWSESPSTTHSMDFQCLHQMARNSCLLRIATRRRRARQTSSSRTGWTNMKNRLFMNSHLLAIVLAALSVGVLAQQQSSIPITPDSQRLRQHVTYLASD